MTEAIIKHLDQFHKEVEDTGKRLIHEPMPEITEELYSLYEKTGNRLKFEHVYFPRRKYLVTFGLLGVWYRRKRDITYLEQVIREICGEECWALPAHVERTDFDWRRTVDLFACETGQTLAELYRLLEAELSDEIKKLIRTQVTRRLLDSYLERPYGDWRWEHFKNNWAAVCAGSLGSMAIDLWGSGLQADGGKRLNACLERVKRTMDTYLEGMMDDGTCPEGLSYYTYGMSYYVGFADRLLRWTKGKTDLLANPKVERIARFQQLCYYPEQVTVSFSDGSAHDKYRLGLTAYLAMRFPEVKIPGLEEGEGAEGLASAMGFHTDTCYRWIELYREDIWARAYLETERAAKSSEAEEDGGECSSAERSGLWLLPDAQWVIGRAEKNIGMAAKGGHNDEPHNHNDVGSFFYLAGGEMFFTDLGCGEYTRDYFQEKRYTILCNRSMGHNLPLIGGREQRPGKEYRADRFEVDTNHGQICISFAGAYDNGLLQSLDRMLWWDSRSGKLTVEDRFETEEEVTENLVTQIEPEPTEDGSLLLRGKKKSVFLRVTEGAGKFTIVRECFHNHFGTAENVWRICWKLPKSSRRLVCRFEITVED